MIDDFEYAESATVKLDEGDILLAYTDGLTEARSLDAPDDLFDEAGVRKFLEEDAGSLGSALEFTESLVTRALEFAAGNQEDDMTLVTVRRT